MRACRRSSGRPVESAAKYPERLSFAPIIDDEIAKGNKNICIDLARLDRIPDALPDELSGCGDRVAAAHGQCVLLITDKRIREKFAGLVRSQSMRIADSEEAMYAAPAVSHPVSPAAGEIPAPVPADDDSVPPLTRMIHMAQQTAAKHDRYKVTIREQRPFFILKPVLAPNEQLTADFIREAVRTALVKNCTTVALDISGLAGLTAPVVAVLLESNKDVVDRYGRMVLCGAKPGVEEGLEKAGVPYFMKIVKNESELTAAAPVTDRESAAKAVPPAVVDMLRQEPSSFRAEINGITSAARDKVERFVAQAVTDPPQAPRPQEPVTPNALPVEPVVIGVDEGDEAVIEIAAERTAGESAGIKQADRQARLDSFLK